MWDYFKAITVLKGLQGNYCTFKCFGLPLAAYTEIILYVLSYPKYGMQRDRF